MRGGNSGTERRQSKVAEGRQEMYYGTAKNRKNRGKGVGSRGMVSDLIEGYRRSNSGVETVERGHSKNRGSKRDNDQVESAPSHGKKRRVENLRCIDLRSQEKARERTCSPSLKENE